MLNDFYFVSQCNIMERFIKKNGLPVSDAVFKSLKVIIPSTTLFKSVREWKSEGKQLPLKLESQTGGYRESQFT